MAAGASHAFFAETAMTVHALRRPVADLALAAQPIPARTRALPQTALRVIGVTAVAWGVRLNDARPASSAGSRRPVTPLRALRHRLGAGARPSFVAASLLAHSW